MYAICRGLWLREQGFNATPCGECGKCRDRGYVRSESDESESDESESDESESDESETDPAPAPAARKSDWVHYAVNVHGADPDEAEAATKAELIEQYG